MLPRRPPNKATGKTNARRCDNSACTGSHASHLADQPRVPFSNVADAYEFATTPGAAENVMSPSTMYDAESRFPHHGCDEFIFRNGLLGLRRIAIIVPSTGMKNGGFY